MTTVNRLITLEFSVFEQLILFWQLAVDDVDFAMHHVPNGHHFFHDWITLVDYLNFILAHYWLRHLWQKLFIIARVEQKPILKYVELKKDTEGRSNKSRRSLFLIGMRNCKKS